MIERPTLLAGAASPSHLWRPASSRQAILQCGGILAVLIMATIITRTAGPPIPASPGACQRPLVSQFPGGALH